MKYIHIVQFHLMSGGGVGSVLTDLCEEMAKISPDVYIISLFQRKGVDFEIEKEWAKKHNINVNLIQQDSMNQIKVICELRKLIRKLAKDDKCVLYLHLKWGVLAGVVSTLGLKNIRRVEVYHSGYMNYKLEAFLAKPFLHYYISVSNEAKEQLIHWFHVNESKISVVNNGVDIDRIRSLAKNDNEIPHERFRFVSVGRLSPEKGFLDSIRAYVATRNEGELENTEYYMIGDGVERKEAETISNGLVSFTGVIPRENVYKWIDASDVVIMPSHWEGNSILLLEALSIGKALVVTDIPSFREVLKFSPLSVGETYRIEKFGAIFNVSDAESCKRAVLDLYNHRALLDDMEMYGLTTIEDYSIKKQASEYISIAQDLFAEG